MMTVLRVIVAAIALALLATIAFGQPAANPYEVIDFSDNEPLDLPWDLADPSADAAGMSESTSSTTQTITLPISALKRTPAATPSPTEPAQVQQEAAGDDFFFASEVEAEALFQNQRAENTSGVAPQSVSELGSYGLLDASTGGFDRNLWQGIDVQRANALLNRLLDQQPTSPTAQDVMYRMLMTAATPPQGANGPAWLAKRAQALLSMGHADAARVLLTPVPENVLPQNAALAEVWTTTQLLADRAEQACPFVQDMIRNSDAIYWRRALLTCQVLLSNRDAVRLSLELTPDDARASSPFFYLVVLAIQTGGSAPDVPARGFDPLTAVLFANTERLITPAVVQDLPDTLLRRLLADETLLPKLRLQAAEELVDRFAEPDDVALLAELYRRLGAQLAQVDDPIAAAEAEADAAIARVRLFKLADDPSQEAGVRALALNNFWENATQSNLPMLAHTVTPGVVGMRAAATQVWLAPQSIRGALLSGDLTEAQNWWQVLERVEAPSAELATARDQLAVALSLFEGEVNTQEIESWLPVTDIAASERLIQLVRQLSVLEAAGVTIEDSIWQQLQARVDDAYQDQTAGPGPLWLRQIARELEAENSGAVLLTLLQPLSKATPAELPTTGIANMLMALRYLGLSSASITLALEALLGE